MPRELDFDGLLADGLQVYSLLPSDVEYKTTESRPRGAGATTAGHPNEGPTLLAAESGIRDVPAQATIHVTKDGSGEEVDLPPKITDHPAGSVSSESSRNWGEPSHELPRRDLG